MLNKFGFLQRNKTDRVKLFDTVNWLSDISYEKKTAIILMKLKNNYFIYYR